jgi:hypothetical protein
MDKLVVLIITLLFQYWILMGGNNIVSERLGNRANTHHVTRKAPGTAAGCETKESYIEGTPLQEPAAL